MSNITPTNAEMLLKAKQLSGVMIQMATVTSNQGSFDTIRSTYDNLAKMDMLSVRKTVADIAEPIMENLGDQFSQQQKDMFVDWMSFPDAKLWRAVGEIIKGFDPAQVMAQSCVLLNSIAMFSPLDTYLYHPKDLKKSSDVVYGAAEDYVNAAMDALKSASSTKIPIKSGDIFRDSIAIACNAATYGVELSQGGVQLLPRRAVATVLATATARLAQQYFQANVSPETKFGDFI
ncbi:hypothetical protein K7432_017131 [Basidiobolus ranarum]|uniref:Uncharacterized protein n=1 Tax=Basidiobolus ranarum TaxID=34480 RepID=A0ABR2WDS6_9FUNG